MRHKNHEMRARPARTVRSSHQTQPKAKTECCSLAGCGKSLEETRNALLSQEGSATRQGSREGRFPRQTLQRCGFGTPARAISTVSQSRCPPDSGGRLLFTAEFFRSLLDDQ